MRLVVHDGDLAAARAAVEALLDLVDRTYSRFRDDSELMRLHGRRGREARVSPLLARAMDGALRAARDSGGAVDPTVGRALRVIGYDSDFDADLLGSRTLRLRVAPVPGWSTVAFDAASRTVRVPADVELDLGSTGKGLAADLAADAALEAAGPGAGVLVSLGGDIATAGRAPDGGWRITVAEDSAIDPGSARRGRGDRDRAGRRRDLEHHGAPLAIGGRQSRSTTSSTRARGLRGRGVAHGDGRRGDLRGRQRRLDRRDRPGRGRARLAGGRGLPGAPRGRRRLRRPPRRLAGAAPAARPQPASSVAARVTGAKGTRPRDSGHPIRTHSPKEPSHARPGPLVRRPRRRSRLPAHAHGERLPRASSTVTRFQAAGWPRFFNYELHRRVSLLSIVFLAVHVLAAVLDPFTSLGLGAALVPFASTYRPIPVALGVVALYLFVALIATSLLRRHIGQKAWRAIHWTSYAMWPLAAPARHHRRDGRLRALDAGDRPRVRHGGRPAALAWRILPRGTITSVGPADPARQRQRRLTACGSWWPRTTRACARSSSSA